MNGKDVVTEFYQAQAKHTRQLNRILSKALCKWRTKDFAAIEATRAARDSAVAALSFEQLKKHAPQFIKKDTKEVA